MRTNHKQIKKERTYINPSSAASLAPVFSCFHFCLQNPKNDAMEFQCLPWAVGELMSLHQEAYTK